ncbi:MAG: purine-binding chemotaxis protein CheW [Rhodobacteraceae bacterium]|jgi:purine-binding chemotaxis protein CheW|nr:chemotaxis protein CheW [Alphaproteobacteria bacterium]MBT8475202.1 chemotaxis protein CheW [Alphaproteobacteria bacterium]NNF71396.1 purine-binding chemotaxis protein CheW [Paracoccaceae bacterium]NNK65217.1 purine-binding chemotaxis protein CheW [Paracoccaceae bacterium]
MTSSDAPKDPTTENGELELLSFRVGESEYSVDIMSVREIRGWTRATSLPHAPHYVRGVINLRGAVLPVIDLALRLGLDVTEPTERNVIIVIDVDGRSIGLRVDAVSDILSFASTDLQPPPDMAADRSHAFVSALTILDGRMIRILDLAAVVPDTHDVAA